MEIVIISLKLLWKKMINIICKTANKTTRYDTKTFLMDKKKLTVRLTKLNRVINIPYRPSRLPIFKNSFPPKNK
jgi:hypothetical protein